MYHNILMYIKLWNYIKKFIKTIRTKYLRDVFVSFDMTRRYDQEVV